MRRTFPNIIITGTPGVGKTTTCAQLVSSSSTSPTTTTTTPTLSSTSTTTNTTPPTLRHLSINALVKDRACHEGYDDELKTWIVDEDKLLDEVEAVIGEEQDGEGEEDGDGGEVKGGWLIDWHACDLFPRSWVDLVVVLRCERTDVLWDRLAARNYPEAKLQENLDAEIFGVLAEEAREAFDEEMVVELKSETAEDVDANCDRILEWVAKWRQDHARRRPAPA